MADDATWYVKTEDGNVYGPATQEKLVAWVSDGRIDPTSLLSQDRISWIPAQLMPELEMKWLIETEPGKVYGPFNRAVAARLFAKGEVSSAARAYRLHELPVEEDPPPVEKIVEKEVIKEVRVEVPVEKIVEVVPPARTELVVAEVVDPVADTPPVRPVGSMFGKMDRTQLAALEAAARKELSAVKKGGSQGFGFFRGK